MSSEPQSADLELANLSKEILACEKKVYEAFLGAKPNVDAIEKLLLPDYRYIQSKGIVWNKEQNLAVLAGGVVFSSIEVKDPHVMKLSSTSSVILARVIVKAAVGEMDLSTDNFTSTIWVKQNGTWMCQLHTATAAAPGQLHMNS